MRVLVLLFFMLTVLAAGFAWFSDGHQLHWILYSARVYALGWAATFLVLMLLAAVLDAVLRLREQLRRHKII